MTSAPAARKPGFNSGWILVTGLLALCVLGTWLTARNYRSQVFTSTRATVLQNQWPESRISAGFSPAEEARIRPGMVARITVERGKQLLPASVVSVGDGVIVRLTGELPAAPDGKPQRYLTPGIPCSVTVDTTIPPVATDSPSPATR